MGLTFPFAFVSLCRYTPARRENIREEKSFYGAGTGPVRRDHDLGCTFLVIRLAMQECGPFWFVCLRFGAASLALALVSLPVLKRFTRREIWGGIVIGVTVYVEYSLQTAGLAYIEASRSAFITAFYVPLVPLFEWLIMRRRPGRMALIGLALAFPGVILLSGMDVSGGLGRGELLTIGCAIVYALEIIVIAMIVPGTDPRRVTLVELVVTALLAGASMPLNGESVSLSPYVLAAGIGLGVCTALIQSVIAWAQKSVPPTKATLIYTGEPVWGGVIGCLYGERLTLSSLAGCALVLAGILISERPEKKAGQPAKKAE